MNRLHVVIGAVSLASMAATSGVQATTRQLAPGGLIVPRFDSPHVNGIPETDDRFFWRIPIGSPGWARVADHAFDSDFSWAHISIPFDSTFASASFTLRAFGGTSGKSQMCYAAYSVSSAGTISAFAGSVCTAGSSATDQNLTTSILTTATSAVVLDVAGQNGAIAKWLQVSG